jgi:glucose/arabinose dehydrogenase
MQLSERRTGPIVAILALAVAACGQGQGTTIPADSPAASAPPPASPSSAPSAPSEGPGSSGSPSGPAASGFDPEGVGLDLELVVDGLVDPLAVTNADDGSGRIFVLERRGQIRVVRDGRLAGDPFLNIGERLTSGGERGLLGLAFHPSFPDDPRLFVNYTDLEGDTVVSSFVVPSADADQADPDSEQILLRIDQPYPNHNGGALAFGPDGYLYIATGDGGSGGDPHDNGQRLDTLLGKILRIDVDGDEVDGRYSIPPDNPFVDEADAEPEIWHFGLRNPWRMSFDRATGDLWIGDVGQGSWEEIDVARAGVGGLNFGWNRMEGFECFEPDDCDPSAYTAPVTAYSHDFGCSVVGGNVYRGPSQPLLEGGYVYSDYCGGNLWLLDPTSDGPVEAPPLVNTGRSISSIGEDEAGELYATDLGSGELLRIVATGD